MKTQDCPKCGGIMYQESVLVGGPTHSNINELYEDMWVCDKCGEQIELTNDYEN